MTEKIFLGYISGIGWIYLDKHSWYCNAFWGFGYIGNTRNHFHISSLIDHPDGYESDWTDIDRQFSSTWINQDQWWILRDLFISAYALKKAAEVYRSGGHQTTAAAPYRVINKTMEEAINADLKTLLDRIWDLLTEWKEAT